MEFALLFVTLIEISAAFPLYSEDVLHFSRNVNGANAVAAARNPPLRAYVGFANLLADISGEAILPYFRRPLRIANKAGPASFDPVTPADRAAAYYYGSASLAMFESMQRYLAERYPARQTAFAGAES